MFPLKFNSAYFDDIRSSRKLNFEKGLREIAIWILQNQLELEGVNIFEVWLLKFKL